MTVTWYYGVVLAIIGSVGDNLGNNLVSLGHKQHHEQAERKDQTMVTDVSENEMTGSVGLKERFCSWCIIGRVVFVLGSLFSFVAFAFGAQSLLASLDSVQFVSNVFFVHYVHHKLVTRRMLAATLSIVGGNVLVVTFAQHNAKAYTSDDMIYLYKTNYIYHGYVVIAFFLWLLTSYVYSKYYNSRMKDRTLLWHHSFMEPFCYSVSSAIIGTQAVLNSKCLALLIEATMSGTKNEFAFWYLYLVLGTWILLVVYWLLRLDGGLALFPPMFIIPVIQVFFMLFAILCGGIYFQEFVHFTWSQYVGFTCGVALILCGVYGLAPHDVVLHVPGEPKVKLEMCDGSVFTEDALPPDEKDVELGKDPVLDKVIDLHLTVKPEPHVHPDNKHFAATVAVAPNEGNDDILPWEEHTHLNDEAVSEETAALRVLVTGADQPEAMLDINLHTEDAGDLLDSEPGNTHCGAALHDVWQAVQAASANIAPIVALSPRIHAALHHPAQNKDAVITLLCVE